MIKNLINKIKKLNKIKFRFDLPKQNKILQYDETNSNILKLIIKKNFNIMPRHKPEIFFWIFLKQVIFLDFTFETYFKNYLKFTSTKIIINLIDNDLSYYTLKNNLRGVNFISIQNGVRPKNSFMFKKNKKIFKNLKCDYFFTLNKHIIKEYKKIIKSKYLVLGGYKNNMIKLNKTIYKKSFLLISRLDVNREVISSISSYFVNSKKKINVLLKSKDKKGQDIEIKFYKNFFNSNCKFHKCSNWQKSYKTIDKFENIIFTNSTLGYEAISRKKKVAIFAFNKDDNNNKLFGWPAKNKKKYNFFLSNKISYLETKRVLDNIYNCSKINWEKKYYTVVKDQLHFDKKNRKLTQIISNLL